MLIMKTMEYIEAFNNKDIKAIETMMLDDFYLEDPVVKHVSGKEESMKAVLNVFKNTSIIDFKAKNIFQDKKTTLIEFELTLDKLLLKGVDVIDWEDNKMVSLRAYLDIPK